MSAVKGPVIIYRLGKGGGGRGLWGDHLIFRRTKRGTSHNWEPKRGNHWKLGKDSKGGPLKFAWKMKKWQGGDRESHQMLLGGSLQWSNIQREGSAKFQVHRILDWTFERLILVSVTLSLVRYSVINIETYRHCTAQINSVRTAELTMQGHPTTR